MFVLGPYNKQYYVALSYFSKHWENNSIFGVAETQLYGNSLVIA